MKKSLILKNKKDINKLFESKDTKTIYGDSFCVKYIDATDTKTLITIPKKKFRKAVDRNRLKRQVKNIYTKIGSYDSKHVVIIYTNTMKLSYSEMYSKLEDMFKKII
jgi:ribonuclease P protein component